MKKKSETPAPDSSLSYQAAWEELQQILQRLQQDNPELDQLEHDVARAHQLVAYCRERLRKTEADLGQLFTQ